ncbi:ecto-NOX disulfide-thiol exchanger 2-like isoform X2 [Maniola jurtina]|uniref:ecto-NOX disulfide-thiol exchanger 2-like isoform X2 n=1 Tax=Maniola jurtina TaxID=191418 RepID=UPI001E686A6E|nr:ecto-NOX disulfide-thiol exchanger 2-like isoform X2 [Maniola jurtina]
MNSWGNDAYTMGMQMNPMMGMMMDNMNAPPMNPPPPVPLPLIGPMIPDVMHVETQDLTITNEESQDNQASDVTSSQNQRRRSRERANYNNNRRDNRDKDQGKNVTDRGRSHRSRSRERHERPSRFSDRHDRNDKNRNDRVRTERKSKWDSSPSEKGLLPIPSMPTMSAQGQVMPMASMNPTMNMGMMSGMMQYPGTNMMNSNMMLNNMMPATNMDGGQQMMMSNMNMMPNMMTNMMDQNMMMMNQGMMQPLMPNQPVFMNCGALLPPIPGTQTPQRRDRPKGCRTIFVGGLPPNITSDALSEMFQRYGNIQDIKSPKNGVYYIRFERMESVDSSFVLSGYRFKFHDQAENEASTMFIDYALNRDDQSEYEKSQRKREPTPPRIEPFTPNNLTVIAEKIKSETDFAEAAPTLAGWLERGECNKKFANQFYSLIQASNNQIRRLFNEKMQLDEDFQNMKSSIRDKFAHVVTQFEQVAKILSAAKHQRVSDHFTKQQRRNIEMWLKMTEEVDNIREEFNAIFDEEEVEKPNKNSVSLEKYEELKKENENLTYELEGYKNEAYLAKDEAERKFEKFKAHFIAQQALQQKSVFPPLPQQKIEPPLPPSSAKPLPPPPTPDDDKVMISGPSVPPTEAKLISILTSFLMVHPLGASLDYLVSYVRSMTPNVTQATVLSTLQKYGDIFNCETTGVGACIEHRWYFVTFDIIKREK